MTLTVAGAGMLWVGWFGFNGGSALAANGDAAMAMLVTHISASAGAFVWMVAEWFRFGKPSALGAVTGMVAGLGTITPASGFVGPAGALVIGLSAGLLCFGATNFLKRTMHIDDSLDVFPVHGVGGLLGTLLTGVFASNALGLFSGQDNIQIGHQVGVQAIGAFSALIYTVVVTFVILKIVGAITALRVSAEEETEGLDRRAAQRAGLRPLTGRRVSRARRDRARCARALPSTPRTSGRCARAPSGNRLVGVIPGSVLTSSSTMSSASVTMKSARERSAQPSAACAATAISCKRFWQGALTGAGITCSLWPTV